MTDAALLTFMHAVVDGDRTRVARLLREAPTLATAPIQQGATRQSPTEYFLDEIQHHVYRGDTALHIAAASYEPAILTELVGAGAAVDATNRRGAQPLHYAVDGGPDAPRWNPAAQRETVARLITLGADPNATDKNGTTPLLRAIRNRCAEAVRALLEGGADPNATNKSGSTAIELATWTTGRGGSGSPESKAQQSAILDLLRADTRPEPRPELA